jgi:nucleoredoxin
MAAPQLQGVDATLVSSSGGSTDISGKSVMFYFSAHWCGPCRQFTPELAKVYNTGAFASKQCEVVFVSADSDDASFTSYFAEQPWLAVPFSESDAREALESKFEIQGYPTLVAVDASGAVISKNARGLVMQDPTLQTFPTGWVSPKHAGECLDGAPIVTNSLAPLDWSTDVASKDIVGLYFSAHWCGPCRRFTPLLIEWYNKMKAAGHSIEIVFISSDKNQEQWMEYFSTMPWPALNVWQAAGSTAKDRLEMLEDGPCEHRGIPHLALLKGSDLSASVLGGSGSAASKIRSDIDGFPWPPKACETIENALDSVNEKAVAMLITSSGNFASCKTAMEEAAVPYFGDGAPENAPVCTVLSIADESYDRLAGFLNIAGDLCSSVSIMGGALLCITDIPSGCKYLTQFTDGAPGTDELTLALAAYVAGRCTKIGIRDEPTAEQLISGSSL